MRQFHAQPRLHRFAVVGHDAAGQPASHISSCERCHDAGQHEPQATPDRERAGIRVVVGHGVEHGRADPDAKQIDEKFGCEREKHASKNRAPTDLVVGAVSTGSATKAVSLTLFRSVMSTPPVMECNRPRRSSECGTVPTPTDHCGSSYRRRRCVAGVLEVFADSVAIDIGIVFGGQIILSCSSLPTAAKRQGSSQFFMYGIAQELRAWMVVLPRWTSL